MNNPALSKETSDFGCKVIRSIRAFNAQKSDELSSSTSLVAVSNKYGLLFCGCPSGVLVLQTSHVHELNSDPKQVRKEVTEFCNLIIPIPGPPSHVAVSCDSTLLGVVLTPRDPAGGLVQLYLYCISQLNSKGTLPLYKSLQLSTSVGVTCSDLQFNPVMSGVVGVCLSDGCLAMFHISGPQSVQIFTQPASAGANCMCWSPKGKQVCVGRKDGKITRFMPDLKEVKSLPPPPDLPPEVKVMGLLWISSFVFLVAYHFPHEGEESHAVVLVNSPKNLPVTYTVFGDICFSFGSRRPPQYTFQHIPEWSTVLCCSSNGVEVAVLQQEGDEWCSLLLEESSRAELPTVKYEETLPMGMTLDLSSQAPYLYGEQQMLQAPPVLYLLSSDGVICPFFLVNFRPQAAVLTRAPERLLSISDMSTPFAASSTLAPAPDTFSNQPPEAPSKIESPAVTVAAAIPPPTEAAMTFPARPEVTVQSSMFQTPKSNFTAMIAPLPTKSIEEAPQSAPSTKLPSPPFTSTPAKRGTPPVSQEIDYTPIYRAMREEISAFNIELKLLKDKIDIRQYSVGTKEEIISAESDLVNLEKVVEALKSAIKEENELISNLNSQVMYGFALVEETRAREYRRNNPRFVGLLRSRRLDPNSQRKMQSIRQKFQYLTFQLQAAHNRLDDDWEQFQFLRKKKQRIIATPSLSTIYHNVVNHQRILFELSKRVENIQAAVKAISLQRVGTMAPVGSLELSKLAEALLDVESDLKRAETIKDSPVAVSPAKQSQLREFLRNRQVTPVRVSKHRSFTPSKLFPSVSLNSSIVSDVTQVTSNLQDKPLTPGRQSVSTETRLSGCLETAERAVQTSKPSQDTTETKDPRRALFKNVQPESLKRVNNTSVPQNSVIEVNLFNKSSSLPRSNVAPMTLPSGVTITPVENKPGLVNLRWGKQDSKVAGVCEPSTGNSTLKSISGDGRSPTEVIVVDTKSSDFATVTEKTGKAFDILKSGGSVKSSLFQQPSPDGDVKPLATSKKENEKSANTKTGGITPRTPAFGSQSASIFSAGTNLFSAHTQGVFTSAGAVKPTEKVDSPGFKFNSDTKPNLGESGTQSLSSAFSLPISTSSDGSKPVFSFNFATAGDSSPKSAFSITHLLNCPSEAPAKPVVTTAVTSAAVDLSGGLFKSTLSFGNASAAATTSENTSKPILSFISPSKAPITAVVTSASTTDTPKSIFGFSSVSSPSQEISQRSSLPTTLSESTPKPAISIPPFGTTNAATSGSLNLFSLTNKEASAKTGLTFASSSGTGNTSFTFTTTTGAGVKESSGSSDQVEPAPKENKEAVVSTASSTATVPIFGSLSICMPTSMAEKGLGDAALVTQTPDKSNTSVASGTGVSTPPTSPQQVAISSAGAQAAGIGNLTVSHKAETPATGLFKLTPSSPAASTGSSIFGGSLFTQTSTPNFSSQPPSGFFSQALSLEPNKTPTATSGTASTFGQTSQSMGEESTSNPPLLGLPSFSMSSQPVSSIFGGSSSGTFDQSPSSSLFGTPSTSSQAAIGSTWSSSFGGGFQQVAGNAEVSKSETRLFQASSFQTSPQQGLFKPPVFGGSAQVGMLSMTNTLDGYGKSISGQTAFGMDKTKSTGGWGLGSTPVFGGSKPLFGGPPAIGQSNIQGSSGFGGYAQSNMAPTFEQLASGFSSHAFGSSEQPAFGSNEQPAFGQSPQSPSSGFSAQQEPNFRSGLGFVYLSLTIAYYLSVHHPFQAGGD